MSIEELILKYNAELPSVRNIIQKRKAVGLGEISLEEALQQQQRMALQLKEGHLGQYESLIEAFILTTNIHEVGAGALHFYPEFQESQGKTHVFCIRGDADEVYLDETGKIYAFDWQSESDEPEGVCSDEETFMEILLDYMIRNKRFLYENIPVTQEEIDWLKQKIGDNECQFFFPSLYREIMERW